MCTNYNAAAAPFADKGIMMEYAHAQSCKVTEHMVHGVECDSKKNAGSPILYTRSSPVVVNQDIKTYDLGNFQLAVANSPPAYANLPIGEIWVQYMVKCRKPKLFSSRGLDVDKDEFLSNNLNPMTGALWFGVVNNILFLAAQQNNIGCLVVPGTQYAYSGTTSPVQTATTGTGCSVLIPSGYNGNLRVTVIISGTTPNAPNLTVLGNITLISDLYQFTGAGDPITQVTIASATSAIGVYDIYVRQATGIAYSAGSVFSNGTAYSGGNSILSFGTSAAAAVTFSSIQIEQYQPLGGINGLNSSTGSSSRVLFTNQQGVVVIP